MASSLASFRPLLHAVGLRATGARMAILATFQHTDRPRSAAQLAELLAERCDRPTVYRNLNSLTEAGLLHALGRAGGQSWYGRAGTTGSTLFICDTCATAFTVDLTLSTQNSAWQHALDRSTTWLSGTCPDCLAAQAHAS